MTAFSTDEEKVAKAGALKGGTPYYLDQTLKNPCGMIVNAKPWTPNAIRDRELITAQNPMSDHMMVHELLSHSE
jgi:putative intracellular protease/amidase